MCPAATWIVMRSVIRRSQVEIGLGFGAAALPRQRMRSPAGTNAAVVVLAAELVERLAPRADRPRSPLAQASSTGPGRSIVRSGVSPAEAGAVVRTARERSGLRPWRRL